MEYQAGCYGTLFLSLSAFLLSMNRYHDRGSIYIGLFHTGYGVGHNAGLLEQNHRVVYGSLLGRLKRRSRQQHDC